MERLSIPEIIAHCDRTLSRKSEGSIFYREHEAVKAYLNELQRYRETGLMPEEVKNWQDIYNEILTRTYGPFHQKIADWLKAEQDGRLVVLPCKVGTPVWLLKTKCKHAGANNKPWDDCAQYWRNVRHNGMWGCGGKDDNGNALRCIKEERVWYAQPGEYSLFMYITGWNLGKDFFLSREEAEAALEKGAKE